MKQIFVIFAVVVPLTLAGVFMVNSIASDNFPLFRSSPIDELQTKKETYQAGLDYCENNYGGINSLEKLEEYENCVSLVETWFMENSEK